MSLGGDSSSSASTTNNTKTSNITTVDNRVSEANARVGGNVSVNPNDINGSLSISTTDQGAIQGGVDIALESLGTLRDTLKNSGQETNATISQAFGLANNARQSETSGAINNFLKYGSIVAGLAILAYAATRARRG